MIGSREQLLHLLAEAAEIEHTLMCSYLYAAFSLKRAGEPGVSAAQGEVLERWRKTIMDVAVEEMSHLLIVANLTVAVGGRPHFGRPNFPVASGYFPSGVTVRLSGFNAETLKHFIFLERPQDVQGEDSTAFTQDGYEREQAHLGLMPSAQDYATIGRLYEAIRTNLIVLDRELGGEELFLGNPASQVGRSVIDLEGVEPITGLAGAQRAIDIIVEQGEGFLGRPRGLPLPQLPDHPTQALCRCAQGCQFRRRVAGGGQPGPATAARPGGKDLCRLSGGGGASRLRVRDLRAAPTVPRPVLWPHRRSHRAIPEGADGGYDRTMHILGEVSTALARLPASSVDGGVHAGMTFTMLRGVEPLLPGRVERHILRERMAALKGSHCDLSDRARQAMAQAADHLSELA